MQKRKKEKGKTEKEKKVYFLATSPLVVYTTAKRGRPRYVKHPDLLC